MKLGLNWGLGGVVELLAFVILKQLTIAIRLLNIVFSMVFLSMPWQMVKYYLPIGHSNFFVSCLNNIHDNLDAFCSCIERMICTKKRIVSLKHLEPFVMRVF
jgi:hypothetical protein